MRKTKKEIKEAAKNIQELTGLDCPYVNSLRHNAPESMWVEAWEKDKTSLKELANTIITNL